MPSRCYSSKVKRALTTMLIASLALAISPAISSGAVKAGDACKKAGQVSNAAGKKYTCIKKGKKLVWNKGVVVITPKPTPTPTPTPSIDPLVAQLDLEKINLKKDMVFRLIDNALERKANNGQFFKGDSRLVRHFDDVRVAAYLAIINHKSKNSHPMIKIEYQISNSFPKLLSDYSVRQIEAAANYWDFMINEPTSLTVKLVTEKDRYSVLQDPLMFSGVDSAFDRFTAWIPSRELIFFSGGGGYLSHKSNGSISGVLMLATASSAYPERMLFDWPATASHEFTHVIQGYFFKERLPNLTDSQYQAVSPNNFREGNANLFGYALSLGNLGWYSDAMDKNLLDSLNNSSNWFDAQTESDIIDLLNATELRTPNWAHTIAYPLGALLYEWILYKYGFDKVQELFKGQGSSVDYSANIKKVIGISKVELYKEAAPYVLTTIKRVKS